MVKRKRIATTGSVLTLGAIGYLGAFAARLVGRVKRQDPENVKEVNVLEK